jgi:hypothetical protein
MLLAQPVAGRQLVVDTTSLATGPAIMRMLLEKTIFRVDVLTLELRFDTRTTRELSMFSARGGLNRTVADSVAAIALDARDVWARFRFVRGVSLGQFVDAVADNAKRARDAGILGEDMFREVETNLRQWYAFLEDRRIQKGDEMFYRIRGDTLRTIFRGHDGVILLDRTDVGAQRRLAVMGGYFAPGTDFRRKLIESLFDRK